jgi:hypothetical protein
VGRLRRGRVARRIRGHARAVPLHVTGGSRVHLPGAPRCRLPSLRIRVRRRNGRPHASRRAVAHPARARRRDAPADHLPR